MSKFEINLYQKLYINAFSSFIHMIRTARQYNLSITMHNQQTDSGSLCKPSHFHSCSRFVSFFFADWGSDYRTQWKIRKWKLDNMIDEFDEYNVMYIWHILGRGEALLLFDVCLVTLYLVAVYTRRYISTHRSEMEKTHTWQKCTCHQACLPNDPLAVQARAKCAFELLLHYLTLQIML